MGNLLAAWDAGRNQNTAARGITLLGIAFPEAPRESLADFTVGERDRSLLQLRQTTFGTEAAALTVCPECEARLEIDLPLRDLQLAEVSRRGGEINRDGYRVRFRLPLCKDLMYAARTRDVACAASLLLERCVESADRDGEPIDCAELPPALAGEIASGMEKLDAQGDVQMALTCPACSARWRAVFDIVSFLWTELDAWAVRLLRQVHTLASAYGWCESDILAMSPARREFYLELVGV